MSCVSYFGGLADGFYSGAAHFHLSDIAADCLHPRVGKHGEAYLSEMRPSGSF